MFFTTLVTLFLLAGVALVAAIIRKYLRTRDIGFIWLGVAVVIWPIVSRVLDRGKDDFIFRLLRHERVGFFPFALVEHGRMSVGSLDATFVLFQRLIGIGLLMVAVFYLRRTKRISNQITGSTSS